MFERSTGDRVAVSAWWVVDATGRARAWARRAGVGVSIADRLVGCSALLDASADGAVDIPLVESAPEGWWFSVGQNDGTLAVSFFADGDLMTRSGVGGGGWMMNAVKLAPHTVRRVDGRTLVGGPWIQSARSERLHSAYGPGWLAVGDSAAAHDPLCSHGITYALETAHRAAESVHAVLGGAPHIDSSDSNDGGHPAMVAYSTSVRRSFAKYLDLRDRAYGLEARWPDHPFWSRRLRTGISEESVERGVAAKEIPCGVESEEAARDRGVIVGL